MKKKTREAYEICANIEWPSQRRRKATCYPLAVFSFSIFIIISNKFSRLMYLKRYGWPSLLH